MSDDNEKPTRRMGKVAFMANNAREAHAAGKVWIVVEIKGGGVKSPQGKPIGTARLTGAFSPAKALELWTAVMAVERSGE